MEGCRCPETDDKTLNEQAMELRPRLLDLYIIKKFIFTFFIALLLIIGIVIIFDISEKIDDFVSNEAPLSAIIFDYYLNFIPYFMNMFSPLFVFITVIFFTSKMASNSEIVAILSCGISFHRMMVPYIVSAAFIALFSLSLNLFVIPKSNEIRVEFESKYIKVPDIPGRIRIRRVIQCMEQDCLPLYPGKGQGQQAGVKAVGRDGSVGQYGGMLESQEILYQGL